MVRFETIMTSNPDRFQEYDPEALSQISQWFGHYRPDHFDQNALRISAGGFPDVDQSIHIPARLSPHPV